MNGEITGAATLAGLVCPRCALFCDDIALELRGSTILGTGAACTLGSKWLRALPEPGLVAFVRGKTADIGAAVEEAAAVLSASRAPALLLGPWISLETARQALGTAALLRAATIAWPPADLCWERAGIDAPELTASLAEVKASAELVVFWRDDPVTRLPRAFERVATPRTARTDRERAVVVVAPAAAIAASATAGRAAAVIALPDAPGIDADVELAVRVGLALRAGKSAPRAPVPVPISPLDAGAADLAARLRSSPHTHVFIGPDAADAALRDVLSSFAALLRPSARMTVSALGSPGNTRGVLELLTWTGAGTPANCGARRALRTPGTFDCVVALGIEAPGGEMAPELSADAVRIAIDSRVDAGARVSFVSPGLDPRLDATVVRSDGVHLTLAGRARRGLPDPAREILARIASVLAARAGGTP